MPQFDSDQQASAEEKLGSSPILSFEDVENPFDKIAKLNSHCANRLAFNGFNFVERYTIGDLHIGLELSILGETKKWYAFFKAANQMSTHVKGIADRKVFTQFSHSICRDREPYMFVSSVQFMEGIQKIVPSLVWLQREDHFPCSTADVSYFFVSKGFKVFQGTSKRKLSSAVRDFPIELCEPASQVIEGASELKADITELQNNFIRDGSEGFKPYDMMVFPIKITTSLEGDRIAVNKIIDHSVEIIDFGFGPFEL